MAPPEKFTVTIGIPAHNEEQNIGRLLAAIVSQTGNFFLEKVIVVCDGCADNTENIVREFAKNHPIVQIISDGKRIGKSERLNQLYQINASDALITLDADIEPENDFVFEKLLEPFRDPQVAVVAGHMKPLPGRTFVEKLVVAKDAWWYEARKNFKNGNNIYSSTGCCFALSRDFTKSFKFFPGSINDQEIIYLEVLRQGKKYIFADDAHLNYREVSTWNELLSRAGRFEYNDDLKPYGFNIDVDGEYRIPAREKIRGLFIIIRQNPFYGIGAFILAAALKLLPLIHPRAIKSSSALWDMVASTKKLHKNYIIPKKEYACEAVSELDEKHKNEWQSLWEKSDHRHFFNSPGFFEACREAFNIEKYAIIFCYRDEKLCAVLPLAEGRVFGIKSYITPGSPGNYVDKCSLLVVEYSKELVSAILFSALSLGHVYLAELDESIATLARSHGDASFVLPASSSSQITLTPETNILQYMSSGQKRNMRQRIRQREKDLQFRFFENNLEQALEIVINVERGSRKHRRHMALFKDIKTIALFRSLIKINPKSVRIGVLFFQDYPAATILGLVYDTVFCWYHTAFLEECRQWGAGKMALYFTLERLKNGGFTKVDFLRGDSELKRQFANDLRIQYDGYFAQNQMTLYWWKSMLIIWRGLKRISAQLLVTRIDIRKYKRKIAASFSRPEATRDNILITAPEKKLSKIIISNYDDIKNPYYGGGGAIAVHETAKRLAKEFEVKVITGSYPGCRNEIIDGVAYVRIGSSVLGPKLGQLIFHILLWRQILIRRFDLWIESFTPPFSTSLLPLLTKKPVIGLAHMLSGEDMVKKYKLPFEFFERIGLKCYKNFIVLTESIKEKIKIINPRASIEVIGNGVNLPNGAPEKNLKNHILYIGRIEVNQKGLDLMLSSYKKITDNIQKDLIICGSGLPREIGKIKNLIGELGLELRVKMLGRVAGEQKEKLYREAAMVVLPSRREAFSLVALEALIHQAPLICFDIEGLRWIPDNCAVKVEPFDENDFAKAMENIANNQEFARPMIDAGWEFGRTQTWDKQYEKYHNYIRRVLESV